MRRPQFGIIEAIVCAAILAVVTVSIVWMVPLGPGSKYKTIPRGMTVEEVGASLGEKKPGGVTSVGMNLLQHRGWEIGDYEIHVFFFADNAVAKALQRLTSRSVLDIDNFGIREIDTKDLLQFTHGPPDFRLRRYKFYTKDEVLDALGEPEATVTLICEYGDSMLWGYDGLVVEFRFVDNKLVLVHVPQLYAKEQLPRHWRR